MKRVEAYGHAFDVLEPAESWAQAMPRFARVFTLDEEGQLSNWAAFPPEQSPRIFRNDAWPRVALVDDFSGPDDEDRLRDKPQRYRDLHGRDHLAPLLRLLREREQGHFYLCHLSSAERLETVLVPPERDPFDSAWYSSDLFLMLPSFAVDDRCDWGLFTDDRFTVLGGEPALMQRFVAESGGLDELIRLFSFYIEEGVTPGDPNYHAGEARFHRRLYDYLGWPWPFAEPPLRP